MARKTPTVWVASSGGVSQATIEIPDRTERAIRLESAGWWAWLEAPTTRSFAYPIYDAQVGYIRGFMTVRKETRERGSDYWVAYRRVGERLRKIYLGRSVELTQRQLAAIAERFLTMEAPVGEAQKEVMPGQSSDALFGWEAMMRRVKSNHQVVQLGRLLVAHYGRQWWYIHGRLLTPKRNYQIESFHSVWVSSFWSRHQFATISEVAAETPILRHWYMYHYYPPAVGGRTPAQVRRGASVRPLSAALRHLIPKGRLPLSAGRIHFMRKVDPTGAIEVLNQVWRLGGKWSGEYVRATINTQEQTIGFWHQANAEAAWQLTKTHRFAVEETVHALLPEFRRKCTRCRDCLPG